MGRGSHTPGDAPASPTRRRSLAIAAKEVQTRLHAHSRLEVGLRANVGAMARVSTGRQREVPHPASSTPVGW